MFTLANDCPCLWITFWFETTCALRIIITLCVWHYRTDRRRRLRNKVRMALSQQLVPPAAHIWVSLSKRRIFVSCETFPRHSSGAHHRQHFAFHSMTLISSQFYVFLHCLVNPDMPKHETYASLYCWGAAK